MKTKTKTSTTTAPVPPPVALPVDELTPRPENREIPDDSELAELAASLKTVGQLHPVHVRPLAAGGYEIVAGVRRWLACRKNGAVTVDAVIHEGCEEAVADAIRIAENEHRREPTALDTARSLRRIKNQHGLTLAQVAEHTSISHTNVKRYLSIFNASDALLSAIEKNHVGLRLAVELVRYEKSAGELAVRKLLKRQSAGELTVREVKSLRAQRGEASKTPAATGASSAAVLASRLEKAISKLFAVDEQLAKQHLEAALARFATPSSVVE